MRKSRSRQKHDNANAVSLRRRGVNTCPGYNSAGRRRHSSPDIHAGYDVTTELQVVLLKIGALMKNTLQP